MQKKNNSPLGGDSKLSMYKTLLARDERHEKKLRSVAYETRVALPSKSGVLSLSDMDFFQKHLKEIFSYLEASIIGQKSLLQHLLLALIGGGHILIEGFPGLAKTLSVKTLASCLNLDCKRIQFTPDLLPADLIGTMIFRQNQDQFVVRKGPIFTQVLLADEINRAPAKVQSALLEAMGEEQVTIGEITYFLPKPFFVMATQNPIEEEGTYSLPAAQLDRFDLKFVVQYPHPQDELKLLTKYQGENIKKSGIDRSYSNAPEGHGLEESPLRTSLLSAADLFRLREISRKVQLGEELLRYVVNIVSATREVRDSRVDFSRYISVGASPRASLALCRYAALNALFHGRDYVLPNDIKAVCPGVLSHRLTLSYEAEAENKSADDVIEQILQTVAVP